MYDCYYYQFLKLVSQKTASIFEMINNHPFEIILKQHDGKDGNLSSMDLREVEENNYDQFFEFWLPGKFFKNGLKVIIN